MNGFVKLSIITVNHNTSDLLKECFSSIMHVIEDIPFEFLVIDSGSNKGEQEKLLDFAIDNRSYIKYVLFKENIGYAAGVNRGLDIARGKFVLITNPDVIYKRGSINYLLEALCIPGTGAVGPRIWFDEKMIFLLPFSELVTPYTIFRTESMRLSISLNDLLLKMWLRTALNYWSTEAPLKQKMLSGACIMTRMDIIRKVGGFDESFPLYFEDTDWCLRLRKFGYNLFVIPKSNIVHFYNQSAKQDIEVSRSKFDISAKRYLKKNFGSCLPFLNLTHRLLRIMSDKAYSIYKDYYTDMGVLCSPPNFVFKDKSRKILLLSPLETMIPSAGSFFEGSTFDIPNDLWERLREGRYFVRAFRLIELEECGAWSWEKKRE